MKSTLKISLIVFALTSFSFGQTYIPGATLRYQEKVNWSWAAVTQIVLNYYGKYLSQEQIAKYATPYQEDAGTVLYGTAPSNRLGVNYALTHFANLNYTYYNRALTLVEVKSAIDQGQLIIASAWSGMYVIYGYNGNYLMHMCPYPGFGYMMEDYTQFLEGYGYPWHSTLVMTSPRGTMPARPIVESYVPKNHALYAFDQLEVNDGVRCYSNTTTTTSYCSVSDGWYWSLVNKSGTYGTNLGVDAKVGTVTSAGPVWLRDRSYIQGNLIIRDATKLTRQNQTVIGGQIIQQPVYNLSFGWGDLNLSGAAPYQNIEPDQPRLTIQPGKYQGFMVKQRSPIRLVAGDYFIGNFQCIDCQWEFDVTNGPIRVYTGYFSFSGTQTIIGGTASKIQLAYLGSSSLYLSSTFNGTVLAPNAHLVLGQASKTYTGMYIAKKLTVHQYSTVRYLPFAYWQ